MKGLSIDVRGHAEIVLVRFGDISGHHDTKITVWQRASRLKLMLRLAVQAGFVQDVR